jgi:glutamate dehydrogenase/leucine dehydrogenase
MSLIRGDIDMIANHGGVPSSYMDMLRNRRDITIAAQDVAITHYL